MKPLEIPTLLKGSWRHVLILTYGVNIPFFESALWRHFSSRCKNKIILADGKQYLEACIQYARNGLARHLNHLYVAEGIFTPCAAHAKLILLTNAQQGRLVVGSGNLGLQGYASGGEQFSVYEYDVEEDSANEQLNGFLAIKEFLETLIGRGYINVPFVRKRIYHMLSEEQTPWLYQAPISDWQPIRHNLQTSLLQQLQDQVGDEPVKELWVMSPFYDPNAVALRQMLQVFKPSQANLLVQPGRTSVDPVALQNVVNDFPQCGVHAFSLADDEKDPYIHAKLYLLKLAKRTVCLQGSPNLSQVAMLRTAGEGNIELANLLEGTPKEFDYLLEAVTVQPKELSLDELDLSYATPESPAQELTTTWQLTGGEWHKEYLYLTFRGQLPDLDGAELMVGNRRFTLNVRRQESDGLHLVIPDQAAALLDYPAPVRLSWGEGDEAVVSNPVFICNQKTLDAVLEVSDETETFDHLGDLDLEDDELEELLAALEKSLVIDRQSVWQLAGRSSQAQPAVESDDDAPRLSYSDIDYDKLRQHPKFAQYYAGAGGGQRQTRTRLEIILSAITDHFNMLLEPTEHGSLDHTIAGLIKESDAETEEEREEEEAEKQHRRWSTQQRIRRVLKNFVQRYLRGLGSSDFQELVGPEVMVQNYIIFPHILWRFFGKDWLEPEFIIDSLLEIWRFFWGDDEETGYFASLDDEATAMTWELIDKHHADATLLAGLYYSARLTRQEHWIDQRFDVRDFWRALLLSQPFEITSQTLEETWWLVHDLTSEAQPPTAIVDELEILTQFETQRGLLRSLEARYKFPLNSCAFEEVKVRRSSFNREVRVNCLVLNTDKALPDLNTATDVLAEWMRVEKLDYYRLATPDHNGSAKMLLYEVADAAGVYWARDRGEDPVDFGRVEPMPLPWDKEFTALRNIAEEIDADVTLKPVRIKTLSHN